MGLFENINSEPVSRLNLREPVLVSPDDTVKQVAKKLREKSLGCAMVVDADNKPTGMFTESMLTQLLAKHPTAIDDAIGIHAAKPWPQVNTHDQIVSVLDALEIKNTRFLSVVDEEGHVVGLSGQKGLMEYIADHFPNEVMVQRTGQKPTMPHREGA